MGRYFGFAPKITRVAPIANTSSNNLFDGEIVRVWGFSVSHMGGANSVAVLETNESSPVIIWWGLMSANQTIVVHIPFIADKGLNVRNTVASTISFSIWHSQVS